MATTGTRASKKTMRIHVKRTCTECVQCGATEDLTMDHYIPSSRGGADTLENAQCLCDNCNGDKGSAVPMEVRDDINSLTEEELWEKYGPMLKSKIALRKLIKKYKTNTQTKTEMKSSKPQPIEKQSNTQLLIELDKPDQYSSVEIALELRRRMDNYKDSQDRLKDLKEELFQLKRLISSHTSMKKLKKDLGWEN